VDHALFTGVAERAFEDDDPADAPKQHAAFPGAYAHIFSDEHGTVPATGVWKHLAYTCDADLMRFQTSARCKDADKQRAVDELEQAAVRLGTPRAARREAIELFAHLRDTHQRLMSKRLLQAACLLVCHAAHAWVKCVVPLRHRADATSFDPPARTSARESVANKKRPRRCPSPDWLLIA
jgi:hypothetical protein